MANVKVQTKICRGLGSNLLNCIGEVKETDFYDSWNQFEGKKVCYCKKCCEKIFNYYRKNGCDEVSSLYFTLQKIDVPFIEEIYEGLKGKKKSVQNYMTALRRMTAKKDVWTEFNDTDIDIATIDRTIKNDKEEEKKKIQEYEAMWGIQDRLSDYIFLSDTFNRYTESVEFINPQQEDLYKDLCRDRLLLRKINDKRYDGDESLDAIQKRVEREMAKLKLDEFESTKPKTPSEQSFFAKIAMIEQYKPAEVYKEPTKYKDFSGLKKYYEDMVLRPLKNTLAGLKDYNIDIDDIGKYDINVETEFKKEEDNDSGQS